MFFFVNISHPDLMEIPWLNLKQHLTMQVWKMSFPSVKSPFAVPFLKHLGCRLFHLRWSVISREWTCSKLVNYTDTTVDVSEILHQLVCRLSHFYQALHIQVVVWDFWTINSSFFKVVTSWWLICQLFFCMAFNRDCTRWQGKWCVPCDFSD